MSPGARFGWLFGLLMAAPSACAADKADVDRFIVANVQFTVLHELGHVVLTELEPPFLGGEEDAADQLASAALLLHAAPGDTQMTDRLIAAAQAWRIEWALEELGGNELEYWDSHPLDIQRYYNIACLIYGSTAEPPAALQQRLQLHYQRAWRCEDDYRRVLRGLRWIQENHGVGRSLRRTPAKVDVIYEPPSNPERDALHDMIRRSGVLEQTARIIQTHFALPRDIHIVLANICGQTAYWRKDLQEIILCYALVDRFARLARFRSCVEPSTATPVEQLGDSKAIRRCVSERVRKHGFP